MILSAETLSTVRWYSESRILYAKNPSTDTSNFNNPRGSLQICEIEEPLAIEASPPSGTSDSVFPSGNLQLEDKLQLKNMPPKLRARSASRSRTAPSSATKMVTPAKKTPKSASKSPGRGRGRPTKKETASRQASKSATPRKAAAPSRSRSRSRGRPTIPDTAASSSKRASRTPKRDVIEATHEVADEDDEMPASSTPRRNPRDLRTQTQSPPRPRSTIPKTPQTFPSPSKVTVPSSTPASCTVLSCIKSKVSTVYNWIDSHVRLLFSWIVFIITWPYVKATGFLARHKPTSFGGNTLLFSFFSLFIVIGLTLAFPLLVKIGLDLNQYYITPFFKYSIAKMEQTPGYIKKQWATTVDLLKARFPTKPTA